jgi:hypothetical protein
VVDAYFLDGTSILVIIGCGTDSDGIYSFDPVTQDFTLIKYLECPNFIAFDEILQEYYVGYRFGLETSTDGYSWTGIPIFDNMNMVAMAIYQNNIVVSRMDNLYRTWHSDDHGNTWTQAPAGGPMISDLVFDHDQKLYGIFPDESWSSGLWSSPDFGYTWEVEFWSVNMNSVAIDVFGDVFVGWDDNPTGGDEGVARYDTASGTYAFMNEGLGSLVINDIRINPWMSAPALFCCTDSGAYFSYDYYVGIKEENEKKDYACINVYPNPTDQHINIDYKQSCHNNISNIRIYNSACDQILEKYPINNEGRIDLNISGYAGGLYYVVMNCPSGTYYRKFVKL